MLSLFRRSRLLLAIGAVLALTLTACGGGDSASDTATDAAEDDAATDAAEPTSYETPFGAACSQVPAEGEGSAAGMADDPVATAASNNPLLSSLVGLVQQAGLVDTLNSAEALTVFAPTNSAIEALPSDVAEAVTSDDELLTTVLSYHVHPGEKLSASDLVERGSIPTLAEGAGELQVSASGDTLSVEAGQSTATVVCGNVQTANASVFLIDTVLQPAS